MHNNVAKTEAQTDVFYFLRDHIFCFSRQLLLFGGIYILELKYCGIFNNSKNPSHKTTRKSSHFNKEKK